MAVGQVVKPYGLAGEVRVRSLSDRTEERFGRLRDCFLWEPATDRREPCRVVSCHVDGETVLVRLDGIDTPEAARELAGRVLAVERDRALPAPEGTFYPWQMEGASVETPDGRVVGSFVGVEQGGAQDLWVIARDGREQLIPAVAEIVRDVSVAGRRIVIDPPEGLLDL